MLTGVRTQIATVEREVDIPKDDYLARHLIDGDGDTHVVGNIDGRRIGVIECLLSELQRSSLGDDLLFHRPDSTMESKKLRKHTNEEEL